MGHGVSARQVGGGHSFRPTAVDGLPLNGRGILGPILGGKTTQFWFLPVPRLSSPVAPSVKQAEFQPPSFLPRPDQYSLILQLPTLQLA